MEGLFDRKDKNVCAIIPYKTLRIASLDKRSCLKPRYSGLRQSPQDCDYGDPPCEEKFIKKYRIQLFKILLVVFRLNDVDYKKYAKEMPRERNI